MKMLIVRHLGTPNSSSLLDATVCAIQYYSDQWVAVIITDLKNMADNMADYIALQYFVFLQKDLAAFTTNEGWSFLISGIWRIIRSSKHLRHPKRREIRRKRLPQDS